MKSAKALLIGALLAVPMVTAAVAPTQDQNFNTREQNFRAYAKLLRTDLKTQRKEIISELMQFDDQDAAQFWPIFEQYDQELTKIGDARLELIVEYARHYQNLTDDQADALISKAFELEVQRAQLKKKYFDKMKVGLSATQATRFFLIENQIQHIIDLQISSELPVTETASK
jgi:Spy/CpxP family protein refolding chaperone